MSLCFEIWLILHLRKLPEISEEDKLKLMANARISDNHTFIDSYLSDCIGHVHAETLTEN